MNRIYSDDIYQDDTDIDNAIQVMQERTQEVIDSMDAVFNETTWKGDMLITEKEIMASGLDDDFIAKVTIVTPTPELSFAIEQLLEQEFNED